MSRHDHYNNMYRTNSFLGSRFPTSRFIINKNITHPGRRACTEYFIHTRSFRPSMNLSLNSIIGFIPTIFDHIEESTGIGTIDVLYYIGILLLLSLLLRESNKEFRKTMDQLKTTDILRQRIKQMDLHYTKTKESNNLLDIITVEKSYTENLERVAKFGELSQGLFHDLIGPLSTVSVSVEHLAKKQISPTETYAITRKAVDASIRMRSFMENIRSMMNSKISDQQQFNSNIKDALSVVLDLLSYKAKIASVYIKINHCQNISLNIHPVRLQQLLLNTISNAIEACEYGPNKNQKKIVINIKRKHEKALITISDNGPGIPSEYTDDLFCNPFTTKVYGTGIGLMTVRTIVEDELKGFISITNVPTGGTLCEISLPLEY